MRRYLLPAALVVFVIGLAVLPSVLADQRGSAEIFRDGFENGLSSWSKATGSTDPSLGQGLFGSIYGEFAREFGGFTQQPPGALVSIDLLQLGPRTAMEGDPPRWVTDSSRTPGGTTFVVDLYDPPPPAEQFDGSVVGLAADSTGALWATTCFSECDERPAHLLRISADGSVVTDIGEIVDQDGIAINSVADLAMQPGTDILFAGTDLGPCSNEDCLYTIDRSSAVATLVGEIDTPWLGGIAFTPDGTLYMVPVVAPNWVNFANKQMLVLDPATAETLEVEPVLLEQQWEFTRLGNVFDIKSIGFQSLTTDSSGNLVAGGDNGIQTLYRRERGVIKDKFGVPITGEEEWVWKLLGDAGEHFGDLIFR